MKQSTDNKDPIKQIGLLTLWLKYFPINYLRIRTAALRPVYIPDERVVTEYKGNHVTLYLQGGRHSVLLIMIFCS